MSAPALLRSSNGIQQISIESKLMSEQRQLFITGEINANSAIGGHILEFGGWYQAYFRFY